MPDDEYKPSGPRDRAARLHESWSRGSGRLQRWSDWLIVVGGGFVLLAIMAVVGSDTLPILGTRTDLLIWFVLPPILTFALATLVRSLRRRRHGGSSSTKIQGMRDALQMAVGSWLGLVAMLGFFADVRDHDGLTGLGGFFGILGVSLLWMVAVLVYRYVVRE